jgi:hypothetical protein
MFTKTNGGHYIHRRPPELVIEQVSGVIDAVRGGSTQSNP